MYIYVYMYIYICIYIYTYIYTYGNGSRLSYIYRQKPVVSNPETVRRRSYPSYLLCGMIARMHARCRWTTLPGK